MIPTVVADIILNQDGGGGGGTAMRAEKRRIGTRGTRILLFEIQWLSLTQSITGEEAHSTIRS